MYEHSLGKSNIHSLAVRTPKKTHRILMDIWVDMPLGKKSRYCWTRRQRSIAAAELVGLVGSIQLGKRTKKDNPVRIQMIESIPALP